MIKIRNQRGGGGRKRGRIYALVLSFLLVFLVGIVHNVLGLTEYLDPDGDNGINNWTPTGCTVHADCIDDAIRQPNTGVDANYLTTTAQNVLDAHTYSNPGVSGTVSDVEVWIYGRTGDANDYFTITPSGVSGWTPSPANGVTGAPGTSNSWVSASWSGLSIDMAEFNSLVITIKSTNSAGPGGLWVAETVYTELTYTGATAQITVTLRKSDNTQERIDVGRFGNMTFSPDGTLVNSSNFVRVQCDYCDGVDDSFWINWSGTVWTSATTGEDITIDNNFRFYWNEVTGAGECPDDGGWTWSDSGVDADGDYQITFAGSGTVYVWLRFRIEIIADDDLLGEGYDYNADYSVELDR